jgi:hypothetical protein
MARYSRFELTLQYAFLSSSDRTDAKEGAMQIITKQRRCRLRDVKPLRWAPEVLLFFDTDEAA